MKDMLSKNDEPAYDLISFRPLLELVEGVELVGAAAGEALEEVATCDDELRGLDVRARIASDSDCWCCR